MDSVTSLRYASVLLRRNNPRVSARFIHQTGSRTLGIGTQHKYYKFEEPGRSFKDVEVLYYYGVLSQRPSYSVGKLLQLSERQRKEIAPHRAIQTFIQQPIKKISNTPSTLLNEVAKEVQRLPVSAAYAVLLKLNTMQLPRSYERDKLQSEDKFWKFFDSLDKSCQSLLSRADCKVQFTLADLFFRLNLLARTRTLVTMLTIQGKNYSKLTLHEVVQHLFFSRLMRQLRNSFVEHTPDAVDRVLNDLDVHELALVSSVLHGCQYEIKSPQLLERMLMKVEANLKSLDNMTMSSFCKIVRYSQSVRGGDDYVARLQSIALESNTQWNPRTWIRLANLGTRGRYCDEKLIRKALSEVLVHLEKLRTKDIASILYAFAYYRIDIHEDIVRRMIECILKENPIQQEWIVRAAFALAILGFYDERLLVKALNKDHIDSSSLESILPFQISSLWHATQILHSDILNKVTYKKADVDRLAAPRIDTNKKRRNATLVNLTKILKDRFNLEASVVSILPCFGVEDIQIGETLLILHHPGLFFRHKSLLGIYRWRVELLEAKGFNVLEYFIADDFSVKWSEEGIQEIVKLIGIEVSSKDNHSVRSIKSVDIRKV